MTDIINAIVPFVCGFAVGYFYDPVLKVFKKIIQEVKTAKQEW